VLDRLERVAPVVCCRGNGDLVPGWGNRPGVPDDPRVDDRLVLDLDGVAVGVVHDIDCYYYPRDEARFAERLDEGLGRRVDLVVCGDASPSRAWGLRCRESMDDAPCLSGGLSLQC
jgi:hypothetical protein